MKHSQEKAAELLGKACNVALSFGRSTADALAYGTEKLAHNAELTLRIEKHKRALNAIYREIGETVVSNRFSDDERRCHLYRLIGDAKAQKTILSALCDERAEEEGACPLCGKRSTAPRKSRIFANKRFEFTFGNPFDTCKFKKQEKES